MAITIIIGGVPKSPLVNSLGLTLGLQAQATCEMEFVAQDGWIPAVGAAVEVRSGGTLIYLGSVDSVPRQSLAGSKYRVSVSCVDITQITGRRICGMRTFVGKNAGYIFKQIISSDLLGETIATTFVSDVTGPIIPTFETKYETVNDRLNALAETAGMVWRLTWDREARLHLASAFDAGFQVTDTTALVQNLRVEADRSNYANRVIVTLPQALIAGKVDTYTSTGRAGDVPDAGQAVDGVQYVFQTSHRMVDTPVITWTGAPMTVLEEGGAPGADCYWTRGSTQWRVNSLTHVAPFATDTMVVTYTAVVETQIASQNDAEVTARAAAEGGTGVYAVHKEIAEEISTADAQTYATNLVAALSQISYSATFETDTKINPLCAGTEPGQRIWISRTGYGVSAWFLIRRVTISDLKLGSGVYLNYRIEASNGPGSGDALTWFRQLAGQGGPGIGLSAGGVAPPVIDGVIAAPPAPTGLTVTVDDFVRDYGITWGWTPPSPVGTCVSFIRQYKFESWDGSAWILDSDWGEDMPSYPASANQSEEGPWPKIAGTYRVYGRIASVNADSALSAWVTSAAQTITPYTAPPQPPAVTLTLAYESRAGSPYYRNLASLASAGTGSTVAYSWQFRQLNVAVYVNSASVDIDWFEFQAEYDIAKLTATSDWWPVADLGKYAQVRCVPINADGTDGTPRESAIVAIGASAGFNGAAIMPSSLGYGLGKNAAGLPVLLTGGNINMVLNPGFEDLPLGKAWEMGGGAYITTDVYSWTGTNSLILSTATYAIQDFQVRPGDQLSGDCEYVTSGVGAEILHLQFHFYNSLNVWITTLEATATMSSGGVRTLALSGPVPAGTSLLRLQLQVTGVSSSNHFRIDNVRLNRVNSLAASGSIAGLSVTQPDGPDTIEGGSTYRIAATWTGFAATPQCAALRFFYSAAGTAEAPLGNDVVPSVAAWNVGPWPRPNANVAATMKIRPISQDGSEGAVMAAWSLTITAGGAGKLNLGQGIAGSLTTAQIAALAVDSSKLAASAVTTAKLANLAVDVTKLADLAVEAAKLANSSVTMTKIANAAVGSAAIAALAVGTAHIANAAITNVQIANGTIINALIANATIESAKIVSLSADKITGGTISATVSMTSPIITVTGATFTININTTDGFKVTSSGQVLSLSSATVSIVETGFSCTLNRGLLQFTQTNGDASITGGPTFFQAAFYYGTNGAIVIGASSTENKISTYRTYSYIDFSGTGSYANMGGGYKVAGTWVVGARQAAVASPIGGVIIDVEARAAIDALLARLGTSGHGLIA